MNQHGGKRKGSGRKRETPTGAEFRFVAELLVKEIGKDGPYSTEDLTRLAQWFFTQARRHEQSGSQQQATPKLSSGKKPPQKEKKLSVGRKRPPPKTNLPEVVTVMQSHCPRGEAMRWNRERYEATDTLLSEGQFIRKNSENSDYHTEKGNPMSWRTVQALLKLGVLVPSVM